MFSQLKITTTTVVGISNCEFDIDFIFDNLKIDENIVKIKCNDKEKTKDKESKCKTFYNQISIEYYDKTNIKLFSNGKFQISGVKNVDLCKDKLNKLFDFVSETKGFFTVKSEINQNLCSYKNKILKPYKDGYVYHSSIKKDRVIINNNLCEKISLEDIGTIYVDKKHINKTKNIYNSYGENMGVMKYNMKRKNKNLCIKFVFFVKKEDNVYDIFVNYDKKTPIGTLELDIYKEKVVPILKENTEIKLYCKGASRKAEIVNFEVVNTNSNIKFILEKNQFLNREKICENLFNKSISYLFEPSKYPGIRLSYNDSKITIFRTGSILISSKKDIENEILPWLKDFLTNNDFTKTTKTDYEKKDTNISVWDLI